MRRTFLMGFAVLAVIGAACAQMPGPPPGPPPEGGFQHGGFAPGGPHFGMHPWKVVTGVPYSATATEEFTQTLAGGNSISRTTTEQLARDSQGRTYTRQNMAGGPFASEGPSRTVIFISDPGAGYDYVLHPDTKIAVRRVVEAPPADARAHPHDEMGQNEGKANPNEKVVSSSGTYQGLEVEIKTVTRTIPAGAIGNSQPIVSTTTTYYSPILQTVVYSVRNDPRFGQSKYSLANISEAEPDAKLFVPPSDYTIKDGSAMHGHGDPH